jgi:hypothetical protein
MPLQTEIIARRRAGLTRRLRAIRDRHNLPALSNRQRGALLDAIENLTGDAPTDQQLRVLHGLTSRGLLK